MQVTETLADGLKREFKVVVPAADIEKKLSERLTRMAASARLPGFRPGKVPTSLLKKRYGSSVMGEVLEQAVSDSSAETIRSRGLRPAMQPKVSIAKFAEGEDLEYTMAMELLPDIEPVDFSSLELERLTVEVPESEIEGR
jgi:trigger factor